MKIRSLSNLPKGKVTTEDLLGADGITDLLAGLYEKRYDIDQFVLLYTDKDSNSHYYWQGSRERIVYILELAKQRILKDADDPDSETE
jgi:hypothetical protein